MAKNTAAPTNLDIKNQTEMLKWATRNAVFNGYKVGATIRIEFAAYAINNDGEERIALVPNVFVREYVCDRNGSDESAFFIMERNKKKALETVGMNGITEEQALTFFRIQYPEEMENRIRARYEMSGTSGTMEFDVDEEWLHQSYMFDVLGYPNSIIESAKRIY